MAKPLVATSPAIPVFQRIRTSRVSDAIFEREL